MSARMRPVPPPPHARRGHRADRGLHRPPARPFWPERPPPPRRPPPPSDPLPAPTAPRLAPLVLAYAGALLVADALGWAAPGLGAAAHAAVLLVIAHHAPCFRGPAAACVAVLGLVPLARLAGWAVASPRLPAAVEVALATAILAVAMVMVAGTRDVGLRLPRGGLHWRSAAAGAALVAGSYAVTGGPEVGGPAVAAALALAAAGALDEVVFRGVFPRALGPVLGGAVVPLAAVLSAAGTGRFAADLAIGLAAGWWAGRRGTVVEVALARAVGVAAGVLAFGGMG